MGVYVTQNPKQPRPHPGRKIKVDAMDWDVVGDGDVQLDAQHFPMG